jgi:hypothetical protein
MGVTVTNTGLLASAQTEQYAGDMLQPGVWRTLTNVGFFSVPSPYKDRLQYLEVGLHAMCECESGKLRLWCKCGDHNGDAKLCSSGCVELQEEMCRGGIQWTLPVFPNINAKLQHEKRCKCLGGGGHKACKNFKKCGGLVERDVVGAEVSGEVATP